MCLKENYSDLKENYSYEYSRHYSAESEYLRRQNMNSKSDEVQIKGHHVRRSPNFDSNSDTKQKKGQNDNRLILGRVSINTRTRPSNALLLGRVLGLDSAHPYMDSLVIRFFSLLIPSNQRSERTNFCNFVTKVKKSQKLLDFLVTSRTKALRTLL